MNQLLLQVLIVVAFGADRNEYCQTARPAARSKTNNLTEAQVRRAAFHQVAFA
jgi:hypothetical protein